MPWDSSRAVPWRRMIREWALFALIMTFVFEFIAHASRGSYAIGLLASFPLYLASGAILAKFGYQRKTLADLKAQRPVRPTAGASSAAAVPRTKPAPTRRTSSGPQRPTSKQRRR